MKLLPQMGLAALLAGIVTILATRTFTVSGAHFDWSAVLGAAQAMSLFAERQLIEIRIPGGKPGKEGSDALQRYCERLPEDVLTLVTLPKLDFQQLKAAWFHALDDSQRGRRNLISGRSVRSRTSLLSPR